MIAGDWPGRFHKFRRRTWESSPGWHRRWTSRLPSWSHGSHSASTRAKLSDWYTTTLLYFVSSPDVRSKDEINASMTLVRDNLRERIASKQIPRVNGTRQS